MSVIKINSENFESMVLSSTKPVLLDFYADWCGPCKMVSPIVDEIANEHPEFLVGKINVDEAPDLAGMFKIVSIPALFALKDGKIINQIVGAVPKSEILNMLG